AAPSVGNVLIAGAPQPDVLLVFREVAPRRVEQRALGPLAHALDRVRHALVDVALPAAHVAPGAQQLKAPLLERERRIRNEQPWIEAVQFSQAIARNAHPLRTIETEQLRARRLEA